MASPAPQITDAEFQVVRGPYRAGDESPRYKGWYFTGRFNGDGDPLFIRKPVPYWRSFQGLVFAGIGIFLLLFVAVGVAGIFIDPPAPRTTAPSWVDQYTGPDHELAFAVSRGIPLSPQLQARATMLGMFRAHPGQNNSPPQESTEALLREAIMRGLPLPSGAHADAERRGLIRHQYPMAPDRPPQPSTEQTSPRG